MNDENKIESKQQSPCPLCGGEKFVWGSARSQHHSLNFVEGESFFAQLKNLLPQKVKARCCANCGNLQLFAHD